MCHQQHLWGKLKLCFKCEMPSSFPHEFQSVRYSSFGVVGPRLFNAFPVNIWNMSGCTVETFKLHLDRFLATVPDEPQVRGYTAMRRAESNSLLHMAPLAGPQRV